MLQNVQIFITDRLLCFAAKAIVNNAQYRGQWHVINKRLAIIDPLIITCLNLTSAQ